MSTATAPVSAPAPSAPLQPAPGSTHTEPFHYEDTSGQPSSQDALDQLFSPSKEASPAPSKAAEPSKEPVPAPTSPATPSKPTLDDGLPPDAPKPVQEAPKPIAEPKGAPELRKAYQAANETIAAKERELADLRAQLTAKPKPELNGEAETYQNRIKELEGRVSEFETELKFADYSRSSEYKETYLAPLESAVKTAAEDLTSFTVAQEDGSERPASLADLKPLLSMAPGAAWKAAREIFGDAAPAIMRYRDQIAGLNQKAQGALEDFRTKGAERLKQSEEQMTQQEQQEAQARLQAFDSHISSRQNTHAALYGPDDKDPDGNKLLEQGRRLVDVAFKGGDLEPGELIKVQAEVAARAAGFGRMVHRNRSLEAKVAELNKQLEAYQKSEPSKGSRDAGDVPQDDDVPSWQRALDAIPAMR